MIGRVPLWKKTVNSNDYLGSLVPINANDFLMVGEKSLTTAYQTAYPHAA
jgi:hypothetical protein